MSDIPSISDIKEAFKKWHADKFGWLNNETWPESGEYCDTLFQSRWESWQAATEATKATGTAELPDGEAEAFEQWAEEQKYDMTTHPLHWLFLNERTHAARQGWKAGRAFEAARQPAPEATAPAQDLSAAILALPKTGYSCAKRADDPLNEFAACGKHCGDEATCPSHEQQSDATVGLTALIRQLLNSPSNSWQQQAAIALQAHREGVGIKAAILALQAGCPYGSANLAADMWKEGFEAYREAAAALASSPANALGAGDRVDAERTGTLYKAVQRAAGELPEGWNICLDIERDAGTVELIDPEGNRELIDGNDGYLCQAVNAATDRAILQSQKGGHGES